MKRNLKIWNTALCSRNFQNVIIDNSTATPILRESNFGEFKWSKNVIFGNFRDSEL